MTYKSNDSIKSEIVTCNNMGDMVANCPECGKQETLFWIEIDGVRWCSICKTFIRPVWQYM